MPCCWKHPHVRGEDAISQSNPNSELETPPRAWGRLNELLCALRVWGNTPTCVGKTPRSVPAYAVYWKHPHVRGEDPSFIFPGNWFAETPPRAWGRLIAVVLAKNSVRNTPTCVGKTNEVNGIVRRERKHPHVRGEDFVLGGYPGIHLETPPRAWGRR